MTNVSQVAITLNMLDFTGLKRKAYHECASALAIQRATSSTKVVRDKVCFRSQFARFPIERAISRWIENL